MILKIVYAVYELSNTDPGGTDFRDWAEDNEFYSYLPSYSGADPIKGSY